MVAAASTEIMQLFHARAPVIGCTFAAEAAHGLFVRSSVAGHYDVARANFSVTKLMATSDENYPLFPCSSDLATAAGKLDNTPRRRSASRSDFADIWLFARALEFDVVIDKNLKALGLLCNNVFQLRRSILPIAFTELLCMRENMCKLFTVLVKFLLKRVNYRVSRIGLA